MELFFSVNDILQKKCLPFFVVSFGLFHMLLTERSNAKDSFRKISDIQRETISIESTKNPLNMDK